MKTAAVYIRVSTDDQVEYSPDAQLKEIKKYAQNHGILIDESHIYKDEGISGRNTKKRSSFNRMIGMAKTKPKPFDMILLWKFSRFARNREDSILYKSMLRKQLGIDVVSISENIGDDKMSVLIEALIEAMDEYYSINLAEEVKRGMTEKAVRGEYQAYAPFGYRNTPKGPLQLVEEEAKYVRYIYERYLHGDGLFKICRQLNAMGIKTRSKKEFRTTGLAYMINNPVYKGYARWTPAGHALYTEECLIVKSEHEPIVDEDTFDKVVEKFKMERKRTSKKSKPAEMSTHYLSGVLRCSDCGAGLYYKNCKKGFQCAGYSQGSCKPSKYVAESIIEPIFLESFKQLAHPKTYIKNVKIYSIKEDETLLIQKQIENIEKMLGRAKQAFLAGIDTLDEYEKNKNRIQDEINQKKYALDAVPSNIVDQERLKSKIISVYEILDGDYTIAQKNAALKECVEKIVFYKQDKKLQFFLYQSTLY